MNLATIKACPVCGNDSKTAEPISLVMTGTPSAMHCRWWHVECARCFVRGREESGEQRAVAQWNSLHDEAVRRTAEAVAAALRVRQVAEVAPGLHGVLTRLEALELQIERPESVSG